MHWLICSFPERQTSVSVAYVHMHGWMCKHRAPCMYAQALRTSTGGHNEQSHTHSHTPSSLAETQNPRTDLAEWFKCSEDKHIGHWCKIKHMSNGLLFFMLLQAVFFANYFTLIPSSTGLSVKLFPFPPLVVFFCAEFFFFCLGFLNRWCWLEILVWGRLVYWSVLKTEPSWRAASSPPWALTSGWVEINGEQVNKKPTKQTDESNPNTNMHTQAHIVVLFLFVKQGH